MKYPPLKSPCKECELKCFRVENPNFQAIKIASMQKKIIGNRRKYGKQSNS